MLRTIISSNNPVKLKLRVKTQRQTSPKASQIIPAQSPKSRNLVRNTMYYNSEIKVKPKQETINEQEIGYQSHRSFKMLNKVNHENKTLYFDKRSLSSVEKHKNNNMYST